MNQKPASFRQPGQGGLFPVDRRQPKFTSIVDANGGKNQAGGDDPVSAVLQN